MAMCYIENMTDEVVSSRKSNRLQKVLLSLLGVIISLASGIGIFYISVMIAGGAATQPTSVVPIVLFCIVGGLLTYLGFRISQKRATRPFYSAKIVFTIGLGGVSIASALAVFISISINSGGGTFVCEKDMQSQIYKAISATVPIGTNLGAGTGFYVSKDGTIITADHVVDGADEVYLNFSTGKIPLKVIDRAPDYDLALLTPVTRVGKDVSYLNLDGSYSIGEEVIASGYPANSLFAGQVSVAKGIISRLITPEDLKLNNINAPLNLEFVQTDTAVNHGNSGGPLVGLCGVVGVVNAKSDTGDLGEYGISTEEGISYAVSAKSVSARFSLPLKH